jgi:putative transcriptional regulator
MLSNRGWVLFAFMLFVASPSFAAEGKPNAIFLVAKPELKDPNFRETVVLVTHPRGGNPWGVIVNRPLETRLTEVFPDQPALQGRNDVLFSGGPVRREGLVFLVRGSEAPEGALPVLRDVFFTGDVELIDSLLKRPEPLRGLRVYSGYAAWGRGQLQNEITRGSWHIVPAEVDAVFEKDPAGLWPELIQRATTRMTRKPQEREDGRMEEGLAHLPTGHSDGVAALGQR